MPVDAYGVGAALFDGRFDFTADIVQVNGKPEAKAGPQAARESETGAGEVVAAGRSSTAPGIVKMKTLEEAMLLLQRIHGLVENYAMAVKRNQPAAPFVQNIRRTLPVAGARI